METKPATAQAPARSVTWLELIDEVDSLDRRWTYYGIPRGGTIVAGVAAARGFKITSEPERADMLLDDVVDSGATRSKWLVRFPAKGFRALYQRTDKWLVFPWESSYAAAAQEVVTRQLELIGEDAAREGLRDTPERVVRSWQELYAGYRMKPEDVLNAHFARDDYDQMIVCRGIQFYSTCEHHLQPFFGRAHIGYLPDHCVVGLSKLARLVDVFARRLQIQERLTEQIAAALQTHTRPKGVGVIIEAQHFCMMCRGVQKQTSSMVTSALKGCFRDAAVRAEFLNLLAQGQSA